MKDIVHNRPTACVIATLLFIALTSCGNSNAARGGAVAAGSASSGVAAAPATSSRELPMSGKDCGTTNLSHSLCAIRLMLDDVEKELGAGAGGGITAVKADSSHGFSITLGMEGRDVTYHYEFDFDASPARVKSRTESVESFGH